MSDIYNLLGVANKLVLKMENYIFKFIILFFIIMCAVIRVPLMKKCKHKTNKKSVHINAEKLKVFVAWLGMCFVPFVYIFTNFLNRFNFHLPLIVRIVCALGLFANILLFYYVHKELSDNWSAVLEVKEKHTLIKTGIYKYIRHPMYTQSWLWVILQGFIASNYFVLFFGIAAWGFLYFTRVFEEEKMLIAEFGDEYINYMQETGRLLPKLKIANKK